jgi:hypothetical protein
MRAHNACRAQKLSHACTLLCPCWGLQSGWLRWDSEPRCARVSCVCLVQALMQMLHDQASDPEANDWDPSTALDGLRINGPHSARAAHSTVAISELDPLPTQLGMPRIPSASPTMVPLPLLNSSPVGESAAGCSQAGEAELLNGRLRSPFAGLPEVQVPQSPSRTEDVQAVPSSSPMLEVESHFSCTRVSMAWTCGVGQELNRRIVGCRLPRLLRRTRSLATTCSAKQSQRPNHRSPWMTSTWTF